MVAAVAEPDVHLPWGRGRQESRGGKPDHTDHQP